MATTKGVTAIWSGLTLTAGAGVTAATDVVVAGGSGCALHIKITNGGTGPTLPAQCDSQVSADDTEYYSMAVVKGGVTSSAVYEWGGIPIDIGVEYVRLVSGSNTGQNVTIDADITEVTAIS